MKVRSFIGHIFRSLGYQIVKAAILDDLSYIIYLKRLVFTNGIDCVFDIGANCGQYRDLLRNHVRYSGPILSYEPVSAVFKGLSLRSKSDSRWFVRHCALGDQEGYRTINIMKHSDLSSFLSPTDRETSRFREINQIVDREDVNIRLLNDVYLEEHDAIEFNRPFLKLDTQGYDLRIIDGGMKILDRFVMVQMEVPLIHIYESDVTLQRATEVMRRSGFELGWISPVSYDEKGRAIEVNIMFINPALAFALKSMKDVS